MKRKYIKTLAFGMALTCAVPAMAQNKVVQGTVLDDLGEPVIGATVKVAGTKTAVITDMDGNYKLSVPKGGKVTVSYIGFRDATTNGGTIKLVADDKTLQEVVVVGYGTQKKAHLTGSVANIPTDDIQDLANGGLASSLGGLVNGLSVSGGDSRPGENARIMIRDTNSLGEVGSTAQQPLFVIDGYIYPNDVKVGNSRQNLGAEAFNNLDASEVESISVLKDRIGLGGRENCHIIQTINASRPGERGPCLAAPFRPTISTAPNALSSLLNLLSTTRER